MYLIAPYFLKCTSIVAIVKNNACKQAKIIWGRYGEYMIAIPIEIEWRLK